MTRSARRAPDRTAKLLGMTGRIRRCACSSRPAACSSPPCSPSRLRSPSPLLPRQQPRRTSRPLPRQQLRRTPPPLPRQRPRRNPPTRPSRSRTPASRRPAPRPCRQAGPWTARSPPGPPARRVDGGHGGAAAIELGSDAPASLTVLSEKVALRVGHVYRLSAWVKTRDAAADPLARYPTAVPATLSMASFPFTNHSPPSAARRTGRASRRRSSRPRPPTGCGSTSAATARPPAAPGSTT